MQALPQRVLDDVLFTKPGAYVLVDGQYGSTGKGVIAGALAEWFCWRVGAVMSNTGPNSGHTAYFEDEKIVLKQLPTFGVVAKKLNREIPIYLTAGAIIDPDRLELEQNRYGVKAKVHPSAAYIREEEKAIDQINVKQMASTGQGVGPALMRKLEREFGFVWRSNQWGAEKNAINQSLCTDTCVFMEVSQGFSLGINSGHYPHVTTRECTVSQALSDAGLSPRAFRKSIMSIRTYPIRVGSTEQSSGPCYPDQEETTWEELGVEPEVTTVTQRVRRVFTFSRTQFRHAVAANTPDVIFLNFVNYLDREVRNEFIRRNIIQPYCSVMGRLPEAVLIGNGPKSSDIYASTLALPR